MAACDNDDYIVARREAVARLNFALRNGKKVDAQIQTLRRLREALVGRSIGSTDPDRARHLSNGHASSY